jgi:hypothetical protein
MRSTFKYAEHYYYLHKFTNECIFNDVTGCQLHLARFLEYPFLDNLVLAPQFIHAAAREICVIFKVVIFCEKYQFGVINKLSCFFI